MTTASPSRSAGPLRHLAAAILMVGLCAGSQATAQSGAQSGDRSGHDAGDVVELTGSHDSMQFLAGRQVRIGAQVSDDVFAAGRDVRFEGATTDHAIAAAYEVSIHGGSVSDLIAAAAIIRVDGTIEDDLVAAARSLRVTGNGTVGGDAQVAAETIEVAGRIGGDLNGAANLVRISGTIAGTADLTARRIVLSPGASIAGDLIWRGDDAPEIADGATVGGTVRHIESRGDDDLGPLSYVGIALAILLSWIVASVLLVAVLQLLLPRVTEDAADELRQAPFANLGGGVALLVLGSLLTLILFVTVVGIPAAFALLFALKLLGMLGLVTAGLRVGLMIRQRGRHAILPVSGGARFLWTLLGTVIIGVVAMIPFVGIPLAGLAIAAGTGAAAGELWLRLRAV